MSFKINKSELDITNEIQCNYYRSNVYLNQYRKKQNNGGYIEIPIHMSKNEPTLASSFFPEMYIANNIYITYPLHKIESVDYDGEMIIEHSSISNEYEKAYFCILLKTRKSNSNENTNVIDRLINPDRESQTQTFELNNIIFPNLSCIYYNSNTIFKSQKIIIFTTLLEVKSSFADFTDSPYLFNLSSNNYSLLPLHATPIINTIEGVVREGLESGETTTPTKAPITGNERIIHCQPISEIDNGDDNINGQLEPSYLVPVEGQFSNLRSTNQFLSMTIYYFSFIVITIGILVILPNTYNGLAIAAIKSYFKNTTNRRYERNADDINNETIIGLNTLEFCVRLFFVLFIIGCFVVGFTYTNETGDSTLVTGVSTIDNLKINTIVLGMYFFIVLITCSLVVYNAKDGLLKQNDIEQSSNMTEDFNNVINNIANQLNPETSDKNWIFWSTLFLICIGIIIFLAVDYKTFFGYFDKSFGTLSFSIIFGIFITLYYLIFLLVGKS
jgi:hypothetical protein